MAINQVPGVGPQNTDIASAVANSSSVQSMVGTQVTNNAPSASTIAAAVSAPSASTIAAAVAAPSASTIATAVAGQVPTLSQITSTVQSNAGSPFGGTWTNLGTTSITGSSVTISSLSSYKYIKLFYYGACGSANTYLTIRFNSDSGANYNHLISHNDSTSSTTGFTTSITRSGIEANYFNNTGIANGYWNGCLTISNAQAGSYKNYEHDLIYGNGPVYRDIMKNGTYISTSGISSITLSVSSGTFYGSIFVLGAN